MKQSDFDYIGIFCNISACFNNAEYKSKGSYFYLCRAHWKELDK